MLNKLQLLVTFLFVVCRALSVTIEDYGDIFHCITDYDYEISRLSSDDAERVEELSFVMIMYRHGNRYGSRVSFSDLFPDSPSPDILCNVKRVKSTYFDAYGSNSQGSGSSSFGLRLQYPFGDQRLENSNCEDTQIADNSVPQMIATGKIAAKRYFSENNNSGGQSKDQFTKNDCSPDIVYGSSRLINRVLDSQVYFLQGLLGDCTNNNGKYSSGSSGSSDSSNGCGKKKNGDMSQIDTEIWDYTYDPYIQYRSSGWCRINSDEFQEWYSIYTSTALNNEALTNYSQTDEVLDAVYSYINESGSFIGSGFFAAPIFSTWSELGFLYCAGVEIPLTLDTFSKVVEAQNTASETFDESEIGQEANKCYNHQVSRSAYKNVYDKLMSALNGDDKKMFVIASQGSALTSFFWGLDLLPENKFFKQGEMVTLEVYKKANCDNHGVDTGDYLFRFTRNGKFVAYPPCMSEYETNDSELCQLNTLLIDEYGFSDAITSSQWRDLCQNALSDCLCGFC